MKKIIGFIGIMVLSIGVFATSSIDKEISNNYNLESLTSINTANAHTCAHTDPWGPYENYRTVISKGCYDENGFMCGIESFCTPQTGYNCYPATCYIRP